MNVSPLTLILVGSISAMMGIPKLPYPKLNIKMCAVNDRVGISKLEPKMC
jgi:hypothetical protein